MTGVWGSGARREGDASWRSVLLLMCAASAAACLRAAATATMAEHEQLFFNPTRWVTSESVVGAQQRECASKHTH